LSYDPDDESDVAALILVGLGLLGVVLYARSKSQASTTTTTTTGKAGGIGGALPISSLAPVYAQGGAQPGAEPGGSVSGGSVSGGETTATNVLPGTNMPLVIGVPSSLELAGVQLYQEGVMMPGGLSAAKLNVIQYGRALTRVAR
jgi:hypothetical protein